MVVSPLLQRVSLDFQSDNSSRHNNTASSRGNSKGQRLQQRRETITRATEEHIFKIEMTKQRLLEIKSAVVDNYGRMMEKQSKLKELLLLFVLECFSV